MIEEILKPNKSKSKKIPLFRVEKVGYWENGKMIYYDDPIVLKLDQKVFYLSDQSESQNDLSNNISLKKK